MKTRTYSPATTAVLILTLLLSVAASATTFQTDTFIAATDFSNDGQDIIVTNCTVTIDGAHSFNSLEVLNGGIVTHSADTYGAQQIMFFVSNEPQVMNATTPATLDNTNVDTSSIVVMNSAGTIVYTEDVDYTVTASNQFVELDLTTNSSIASGATVLVSYDWNLEFLGFNLTINSDVDVAPGGAIDLSGKGYGGGYGFSTGTGTSQSTNYPFAFTAGSGAGHGGCGGLSSTFARGGSAYDSTTNPGALGSGGGYGSQAGGSGGGLGELNIGGILQVDGSLLADGLKATNAHAGGGAGGSILVTAATIAGAGTISANGGGGDTPDGGGGGGGRIAIYFETNNFSGNISAFGGSAVNYGGAGTIYLQASTNAGQLIIANNGQRGTNTFFSPLSIGNLSISGGAIAQAQLPTYAVSNLYLGSNSSLVPEDGSPLTVTVNGSATVDSNATISADFRSLSGLGNGTSGGSCNAGSGGSYGGVGGSSACGIGGGKVYGSITRSFAEPLPAGSAGGGTTTLAPGGGAINLTVADTLTVMGTISANGAGSTARANGGGGSGGGIQLFVGTLSGSGTISANGGAANNLAGGGGGGGRIAVYSDSNLFTGDILAHGGAGANAGGAGTIYLNASNSIQQVIVDNGGLIGPTALPLAFGSMVPGPFALTISGDAVLTNFDGSIVTLSGLFIGSNSFFVSASTILTVSATNATIQSGGGIVLDGMGTGGGGNGQSLFETGGGGGNGGVGGASSSNALGGTAGFGSTTSPNNVGGNGGFGTGPGGNGGGVVNLTVRGSLQLDGRVSANGLTGSGVNSGGGAGGSILMNLGTLTGAGSVTAIGGSANNSGGGGGGGRIAISYRTNSFAGNISAPGGAGAMYGGAGTIYLTRSSPGTVGYQELIVDNGGTRGTNTPINNITGTFDLVVTGGAVVSNFMLGTVTLGNLLIGSNSTLFFPSLNGPQSTLEVFTNATIQIGGALSDDGVSTSGESQGQSLNSTGGGGGYGGMGGNSLSNALGGNAFPDSITSPQLAGSRGGFGLNQSFGGNGGGAPRIQVNGILQLDGKISADGAAGPGQNSGGGSGGSVNLTVGRFQGAGLVSANGGAGNSAGGGGGGGRIAVSSTVSNGFAGSFSAHGGAGGNFGGAGTIYVASSQIQFATHPPQLILDNGGTRGANTPIFAYPNQGIPFDLIITNGATLLDTNSSLLTLRDFMIGSNSTYVPYPFAKTITVQTNATIFAGGRINGDGISTAAENPGLTLNGTGGGGGHGGYGGASLSNAPGGSVSSDSFTEPTFPGSRGGAGFDQGFGGNGGGILTMNVQNTLQVDGIISVNGSSGAPQSGAGSGGSIQISTITFKGAGIISANGGSADSVGGGGAGGRIAVSWRSNSFSGSFTARGGAGAHFGGAGTIYTSGSPYLPNAPTSQPQLVIDNGGIRGSNTLLSTSIGGVNLVIGSGASVILGSPQMSYSSLMIASNASLGVSGSGLFNVIVTGNATIQPGGAIQLDGEGFAADIGPGSGRFGSNSGSGAGHGGYGSAGATTSTGGLSYDPISSPSEAGSGGGSGTTNGSAGGGAMHLTVSGILTVNGSISANGVDGISSGAGGGSGGALWCNAGILTGSGAISANGGDGEFFGGGGGGAGGRIAVYFNSNQFAGTISADGGQGFQLAGGAGTIYLANNISTALAVTTNSISTPIIILDNAGNPATNTPVTSINGLPTPAVSLSVANGAVATTTSSQQGPLVFENLSIGNGGEFVAVPMTPLYLSVLGNADIDSGGAIIADFQGEQGAGDGRVDFVGDGSGGGYGGRGGISAGGAPGGNTYGSSNEPALLGSPGGISPLVAGFSQGGGAIRLTVNGALTLNGNISANGNNGFIDGSGGGSGGSIWIMTQNLSGNGSLTANGGAGQDTEGGGGGGGRIAIYASTNSFLGSVLANGGAAGAAPGQNGSIYFGTNLVLSGIVADTNGVGVSGVSLAATGAGAAMSDANGLYSIPVPLFWSGALTPSGSGTIIPSSLNYSDLSTNALDQNFVVTLPSAFLLSCGQCDGTNMNVSWYGISGASYQLLCSTDLVNWVPCGTAMPGTNGPAAISMPVTSAPQMFYRLNVTY